MFKMMPVLNIQSANFSDAEYEVLVYFYDRPNDSYVQTNLNELEESLLNHCKDEKIEIANSLISKIREGLKEYSIPDNKDFILLIWW